MKKLFFICLAVVMVGCEKKALREEFPVKEYLISQYPISTDKYISVEPYTFSSSGKYNGEEWLFTLDSCKYILTFDIKSKGLDIYFNSGILIIMAKSVKSNIQFTSNDYSADFIFNDTYFKFSNHKINILVRDNPNDLGIIVPVDIDHNPIFKDKSEYRIKNDTLIIDGIKFVPLN